MAGIVLVGKFSLERVGVMRLFSVSNDGLGDEGGVNTIKRSCENQAKSYIRPVRY